MRDQREVEMGASGCGQPIRASGEVAARTGRTQTRYRHDCSESKSLLTRGGRPHNPIKQGLQLRRTEPHPPVAYRRPAELAVFQAFGDQHDAGTIPEDQLYWVSPLRGQD